MDTEMNRYIAGEPVTDPESVALYHAIQAAPPFRGELVTDTGELFRGGGSGYEGLEVGSIVTDVAMSATPDRATAERYGDIVFRIAPGNGPAYPVRNDGSEYIVSGEWGVTAINAAAAVSQGQRLSSSFFAIAEG